MTPRKRKELDARSTDFTVRFAIHLRDLVDKRRLSQSEFLDKLQGTGLDIAETSVEKWLSGDRLPRLGDLESIAAALGMRDYRQLLPAPV